MNEASNRKLLSWIGITLAVMFITPFVVAKFASECAGMALCMMLFLIINPIYSIILGIVAGQNIKALWNLPLISGKIILNFAESYRQTNYELFLYDKNRHK